HPCHCSPHAGRRDRHPAEAPMSFGKRMIMAAACAAALALAPSAHAEDFFSALFGAIGRGLQPPPGQPPFGGDPSQTEPPRPRVSFGGPAWCVRACDGRYFPI